MRQLVYIRLVWLWLALAVLSYLLTFVSVSDSMVLRNGATLSDLLYFNACYASQLFGSLAFSFAMLFICENYPAPAIAALKYTSLALSVLLMWRALFNLLNYDIITGMELKADGASLLVIAARYYYTFKHEQYA